MRRLFRAAVAAAIAGGTLFLVLFVWVWRVSRDDQPGAVDAIVVLGAAHYNGRPSPVLKARVDHALDLYRRRRARTIVVTGGTHPGDRESEARVQHRYLVAAGVPPDAIVELPQGHSTEASMTAVGTWARPRPVRSILLVSDGFHLARLRLEASRVALRAYTSPAPDSPIEPGSGRELGHFALEAVRLPVAWARSFMW